jgi:uncharacterized protein YjiS (DUF1127 family)
MPIPGNPTHKNGPHNARARNQKAETEMFLISRFRHHSSDGFQLLSRPVRRRGSGRNLASARLEGLSDHMLRDLGLWRDQRRFHKHQGPIL